MAPIRVAVQGAKGKMGLEVINAVSRAADMELVGAIDKKAGGDSVPMPEGKGQIPFSTDARTILTQTKPQVLVDFSAAEATMASARIAADLGVNLVIGTTGLTTDDVEQIEDICKEKHIGAVVASNFALGAVLMIHFGRIAAKYFDYAEIVEMHHEQKKDAPSGTAITTAQAMIESRGKPFEYPATEKQTLPGTRGGQSGGIAIHSMRLKGLNAHQEIVFGDLGQTLTIRHDSISRESFMPGVLRAVRAVVKTKGLTNGMDKLLGL